MISQGTHQMSGARGAPNVRYLALRSPQAISRSNSTVDRSAQNIASWATYLPNDCVAKMISLGWDHST
jgi:hypothetical protein